MRKVSGICSKRPSRGFEHLLLWLFPDPFSPIPRMSAATWTLEGTEEDPEPTDKGDIHMGYSSH